MSYIVELHESEG